MPTPIETEKRRSTRHEGNWGITVEEVSNGRKTPGRLYNHSSHGAYIELDRRLPAGTVVRCVVDPSDPSRPIAEWRAEVRWSKEIHAAMVMNSHGAGIEFTAAPRHLSVVP